MDIPPPPGPYAPPPGGPQDPPGGPQDPQGHAGPHGAPGPYGQPGAPWPPPGQVPYQRWPGPYSPYSRPPVNGFAIASLVLGILCFLPAVGLVLGLVALAQIKKKGERGKGLAIAGSVLSVVGVVLLVLAVVTGGAREFVEEVKEGARDARRSADAFPVGKGGCFDAPDGDLDSMKYAFQVDEVPCSGPHDGEVFGSFRVDRASFPGDDVLADLADSRCTDLAMAYSQDSWADSGDADLYYFMPDRTTWRQGDRDVTCLFGASDPEQPLKGSLRSDETTLDGDQRAYLEADRAFEEAFASAPGQDRFEDDLEGHKKWAARVDKGLGEQARLLRAHDWPATAQGHVDTLLADIGKARKEWAKAASAADADSCYEHYVAAFGLVDGEGAVGARTALGLGTTSPRDATPGDGSGPGGGDHEDAVV